MAIFIITAILLSISSSEVLAVCRQNIPECQCINGQADNANEVMCYGTSLWNLLRRLADVSPDVTSLHLGCSDYRQNILSATQLGRLSQLTSLSVEKCSLIKLESNLFTNLPELKLLRIESCRIQDSTVDPCLFSNEDIGLQALTFSDSGLTSFPSISNLESLVYFNVSKNKLSSISIDGSMFCNQDIESQNRTKPYLANLRLLDLSDNTLMNFPDDIIENAHSLEQVHFQNNNISEFVVPCGLEFSHVNFIDGAGNPLEVVTFPWDVDDVTSCRVKNLRLDGHKARAIDVTKLSALKQLTHLRLRNFAITDTIWPHLQSPNLFKLDLSENDLQGIDVSLLPSLGALIVAHNNISNITSDAFSKQTNLLALNISYNSLTTLPERLFRNNHQMLALDISNNLLQNLHPSSLHGLNKLLLLFMHDNQIESIPDVFFRDLFQLLQLELHRNKLTSPPNLTTLGQLNRLDLSYNRITSTMVNALEGLDSLQYFNVSNNKLEAISPDELSPSPDLLWADYSNNSIDHVGSLGAHKSLLMLRLDHNLIRESAKTSPFIHLEKLKYLLLDNNNISRLRPDMFPPSLEYLILSQNPLYNVFKGSFENLPHLKEVNLMLSSKVQYLPFYTMYIFGEHNPKPVFKLGFNVLRCDCAMAYLKIWDEKRFQIPALYKNYPKFEGLETVQCNPGGYLPSQREGSFPFKEVKAEDFSCPYNKSFCELLCDCCENTNSPPDPSSCWCVVTCPSECSCFEGNSNFTSRAYHILCTDRQLSSVPKLIPPRAKTLFLDGNQITYIYRTDLNHLRDTERIFLNGSQIEGIEDGSFENIRSIKMLYLYNNSLQTIGAGMFGNISTLTHLYLHDNLITRIDPEAFDGLTALEILTLHNNEMTQLSPYFSCPPTVTALTLADNPWTCNCEVINNLATYIRVMRDVIKDRDQVCCHHDSNTTYGNMVQSLKHQELNSNNITERSEGPLDTGRNQALLNTSNTPVDIYTQDRHKNRNKLSDDCFLVLNFYYAEMCPSDNTSTGRVISPSTAGMQPGLIAVIALVSLMFFIILATLAIAWKRKEVQAWVYVKMGLRVFDNIKEEDKEEERQMAFDAFISYNNKDEAFVVQTLIPKLEAEPHRYRICVHYRDFPVGANITDSICSAISQSSRTIMLLSRDFIESEWCKFEFQTAHHKVISEGTHKLIFVLLEDIPEELIDPDMKALLKTRTYLKVDDNWFWEKLFFALPDIHGRERELGDDAANPNVFRGMRILMDQGQGQSHNQNEDVVKGKQKVNNGGEDVNQDAIRVKNFFKDPYPVDNYYSKYDNENKGDIKANEDDAVKQNAVNEQRIFVAEGQGQNLDLDEIEVKGELQFIEDDAVNQNAVDGTNIFVPQEQALDIDDEKLEANGQPEIGEADVNQDAPNAVRTMVVQNERHGDGLEDAEVKGTTIINLGFQMEEEEEYIV